MMTIFSLVAPAWTAGHGVAIRLRLWRSGSWGRMQDGGSELSMRRAKYVADVTSKKSAAGHASALKRRETRSTSVGTECQHNGQQIKIKPKIDIKEDRSSDLQARERGDAESGALVSSNEILKASEMARARGWTGGNDLGIELKNIFLKFITVTPDKPDLAFLKWVPSQLEHEIKHNGGPNG